MARYEDSIDQEIKHKVLSGGELLQVIGFDESFCKAPSEEFENGDLVLLAGNAMNGFALSAFMISFMASLRQREVAPSEEGEEGEEADSKCNSSSASDLDNSSQDVSSD